jgi:glycolate oxidase
MPDDLVQRLRQIVGDRFVIEGEALEPYSHDGTFMESPPLCAVLPNGTVQVAEVVRLCAETGTPIVARGSGTSLTGGSVPIGNAIVLGLERLDHIEIDVPNTCAVAGAGAITGNIDEAAAAHGLMYPPDPASVSMSTIGGNVACNSGGMCCVKYGVTSDYVIGMTVVLADASVLELGGKLRKRASGYRLAQLFVGSEGTLGIVTEVILKLIPRPRYHATAMVGYDSVDDAAAAVSRLLSSGHFPAAIEILDQGTLQLVAEFLPPGFHPKAEAVLIVEQDGSDRDHVQASLETITELLGGVDNRIAQSEAERERLWNARRSFGKVLLGMRDSFFAEDVAVPISQIPEMVRRVRRVSQETGVEIVIVGHAGDGNLHPTVIFREEQRHLVGPIASRIFRDALELGGSVSAEHGLGALKRDYAEEEHGPLAMGLMRDLKRLLDPKGILNPHKIFPEQPADEHFLDRQPGWGAKTAGGRDRSELGA